MSQVEDFLTAEEEAAVVAAIVRAEKNTSAEIRVHIERHTDQDHFERAKAVFHYLKMDNTKEENGVLIYVAVHDKRFVVLGDKGINTLVPKDFWDTTREAIEKQFKQRKFMQGLIDGVLKAGEALAEHFPWDHNNTNELSNEVSKS
ncbi:TPM domain-containing protein [Sediminicola sp. 1XM1-17]|uniref:TPM domain-containing protein n=1 Tax=Sediminicola sp. 1XM1-17 TaxID=3127702 RepID=UPI0030783B94